MRSIFWKRAIKVCVILLGIIKLKFIHEQYIDINPRQIQNPAFGSGAIPHIQLLQQERAAAATHGQSVGLLHDCQVPGLQEVRGGPLLY